MFYKKYIKRLLDVTVSLLLSIILAIPMGIIAIIIKLTSKGPVLFKQTRYGMYSVPFTIYKFRTMRVETPIIANQHFSNMGSYLTPIGKFLRKSSIDELPQLWNVLKGDMSFVGPRPLAETDIEVVKLREKNGANLVRPGITGLAQVNGRNNLDNEMKAMYDGVYVQNLSFLNEVKVVLQTFLSVSLQKGINHKKTID